MNALSAIAPITAYGLLAHSLIFGALFALLPLGPLRHRAALGATALALVAGIAPSMHGVFGTPSLTLLQLAILAHAGRPSPFNMRIACGLLGFSAIFYIAALGLGPFDPYAPGYQPLVILAALAPLGLLLWWRRQHAWLTILAVDLAGYASGLFANLWDTLFDPLLVALALLVAGYRGIQRLRRRT